MAKLSANAAAARLASKRAVTPVFNIYVIENTKTGGKYVTVRQNISGEAFLRIVTNGSRATYGNGTEPIIWSFQKYGPEAHTIRRVGQYTSKTEARIIAAKMIENVALKGLSLNGGRARAGASETFVWLSEAETKARAKTTTKKSVKKQPVTAEASA